MRTAWPSLNRAGLAAGRSVGVPRASTAGHQPALDRQRRVQRAAGRRLVGLDQMALGKLALQRGEPDLVVTQPRIVGQRLARRAAHVDVPGTGGTHRQRHREHARLPRGVERLALGLGRHAAEAAPPA
jgi:hypothetical protein